MGFIKNFGQALKRQLNLELEYLGGHPDLKGPQKVTADTDGEHLLIYSVSAFKSDPILRIPKQNIVNVTLEKASKRSVGGAAAGFLVGGVIGAAIGGRSKDASIIVMSVKYGPATVDVVFGGADVSSKYSKFVSLLSAS